MSTHLTDHARVVAAIGVKGVIDLTSDDSYPNEKSMVESAGMKYFHIPMNSHKPPTNSELSTFLNIVSTPDNQPVYVHCAAGKHRTGVMTAIYRINQSSWSADQAYEEMKKYKFGPSFFHPKLKEFVYDYHSSLSIARSSSALEAQK